MNACDTQIDPRAAWRADVLKELVEAGMEMVRDMRTAAAEPEGPDMSLRFGRVAKAVRMTLALDARLSDEASVAAQARVAARLAKHRDHLDDRKISARNALVSLVACDIWEGEMRNEREYEDIDYEIERTDFLDEDYEGKPISQIVATLCDLLDIAPDWSALRYEDWAKEERRHPPPGSVFANGDPPPFDWKTWYRDHPYSPRDERPPLNPDTEPVFT